MRMRAAIKAIFFIIGWILNVSGLTSYAEEDFVDGFLDGEACGLGFIVGFFLCFADHDEVVGLAVEDLNGHLDGVFFEEPAFAHVAVAEVDNHGLSGVFFLDFMDADIATAHEEAGDEVGGVDAGAGGGAVGVVAVAPGVAVDGATLGGGGDIEVAVAVERTVAGDRGGAYGEAAGEKEGSDAEE